MPRGLNRCTFIGTLAHDPIIGEMPDRTATTKFMLSVSDNDKRTTLVPITGIGKVADVCNRLLRQGTEVYVEGRFQMRQYLDDQSKQQVVIEIALENMQRFKDV
jgi:single-strand DNA-binding protein